VHQSLIRLGDCPGRIERRAKFSSVQFSSVQFSSVQFSSVQFSSASPRVVYIQDDSTSLLKDFSARV
jgi:uncharacterized protein YjbI with pentapeptide repeats